VAVRDIDPLSHRFAFHPAKDAQTQDAHEAIREAAYALACVIEEHTVPSREQSTALTKTEEAMMWANASIAREGRNTHGSHGGD
jgi:hypothetical protein